MIEKLLARITSVILIGVFSASVFAGGDDSKSDKSDAADSTETEIDYGVLPDDYVDQIMQSLQHYGEEGAKRSVHEPYTCSQSLLKDDGQMRSVYGYCVIGEVINPDGESLQNMYFVQRGRAKFLMELF